MGESEALHSAREERRGVRAALAALESTTASSAHNVEWFKAVHERLTNLQGAFDRHIAATEAEGGLFDEIVESAPRLNRRTQTLRQDHIDIRSAIEVALADLPVEPIDDPETVAATRAAITDIMGRVTRHRQLGSDLVYEAYTVDIEAAD
jgi:hypothetical protein